MEPLRCPHCQTAADPAASVCTGCGAEIVRGASRRERATAGCVFSLAGCLLALAIIGFLPLSSSNHEQGFAVVLGILAAVVFFNVLGRTIAMVLFKSKLRFFRDFLHR